MANKPSDNIVDPAEQEFRKKNQWYSFTGHLYSALGGAAFIGLLGTAAKAVVDLAAGVTGAGAIFGALPLAVMGGLMVIGTACIYMAQKEFTELKCIGDEHLAIQNAKKLTMAPAIPAMEVHQGHHCSRTDGKSWQEVVASGRGALQEQGRT
ncbi:MAG: hypothetical protein AB7L92_05945 [Alphaproteobacteria bacterium]